MKHLFLLLFTGLTLCVPMASAQTSSGAPDTVQLRSGDSAGRSAVTAPMQIVRCADDALIYPNPAGNELNVLYEATSDIKNIAVYNLIGKMVAVYKVTGNSSANLNLDGVSPGIYFVRLFNSQGEAVISKKFTRQ
ncbi:MAG: T9SS type A sorting domain-containing protein [Bacteroidota bacterium]